MCLITGLRMIARHFLECFLCFQHWTEVYPFEMYIQFLGSCRNSVIHMAPLLHISFPLNHFLAQILFTVVFPLWILITHVVKESADMKNLLTVLPEKYSEKDIVSTMMGVIIDYVPISQNRSQKVDEQVIWLKFEDRNLAAALLHPSLRCLLMLSVGTCSHFYFWGLMDGGEAKLLYCERNKSTIDAKILPSECTTDEDAFSDTRPIIALCDSHNRACSRWQVRFVSLMNHKTLRTLCFESKAVKLDANTRFVIVGRVDCITVLAASTLSECFTISCVNSSVCTTVISKCVPFSLGHRWIAFSDPKPIFHHLSRCGDASSDESEPLTSTMLNMNKRLWRSLSTLASAVSSVPQTGPIRGCSRPVPGSPGLTCAALAGQSDALPSHLNKLATVSPGYVTVVDLVTLTDRFSAWKKLNSDTSAINLSSCKSAQNSGACSLSKGKDHISSESVQSLSGTLYLNVHEYSRSGAMIAHFMAHRWATIALLKFDPTGSLLFTACVRGHTFNIFRLSTHPFDERQTAVHHLYILERGTIPCEVMDAAFSWDSRWLSVSTNHGTAHVFPVTPYGGPVTVRTHTRPYVVNRTSRYHRSSGLEEHHLTRPQPERGSADSLMTSSGSAPSESTGVRDFSGTASFFNRGSMCRFAPVAGFSPQCPHVGVQTRASPITSGSYLVTGGGDNDNVSANSSSATIQTVPVVINRACACPPNAIYATTNPRLPPYPEPCHIKPEIRLRPHSSGNATTGAAVAALGAATGALEAVTASNSEVDSQMHYPPSSDSSHPPGSCIHLPNSGCNLHASNSKKPIHPYSSPNFDRFVDSFVSSSGITMATCFAPPLYLFPDGQSQRSSTAVQGHDQHGKVRTVDGLFTLTSDLYLVEYNMFVGPATSKSYGEKLYQEGSLHAECSPVAEWNLRTDSICVPPFSKHHPFRFFCTDTSDLNEEAEIARDLSNQSPRPSDIQSNVLEFCAHPAAAPEGWSAEDAASYWYSQVEITTHLGPLRRVWMGPQFNFRSLSKLFESGHIQTSFLLGNDDSPSLSVAPIESLDSADINKLLPACVEPAVLSSYYDRTSCADPDSYKICCATGCEDIYLPTRSSFHGTSMTLPEFSANESTYHLKSSPNLGSTRLPPSRLLDGVSPGSPARWRTRSGEPSRPMNIPGVTGLSGDATDLTVFIEGGSYQDSSLGGSLSSLIGRAGDDVASCIADAIQDEDVYSPLDQPRLENAPDIIHVGQASSVGATLHLGLRINQFNSGLADQSTSVPSCHVPIESALSESDFPSHEGSPHQRSTLPLRFRPDFELRPSVPDSTCGHELIRTSMDENSHLQTSRMGHNTGPSPFLQRISQRKRLRSRRRETCVGSDSELIYAGSGAVDEDFRQNNCTSLSSPCASLFDCNSPSSLPRLPFEIPQHRTARFRSFNVSTDTHEAVTTVTYAAEDTVDVPISDHGDQVSGITESDLLVPTAAHNLHVTTLSESGSD